METNRENTAGVLTIAGVDEFNPEKIFDCGQCFRWEKLPQTGVWHGVVADRVAEVLYERETKNLQIWDSTLQEGRYRKTDAVEFWNNYFDLNRDYEGIKKYLLNRGNDDITGDAKDSSRPIEAAIRAGSGIRILNQDRWETLVSFIISQNNNIPRIKKCINSLTETLGEPIDVSGAYDVTGEPLIGNNMQEGGTAVRANSKAGESVLFEKPESTGKTRISEKIEYALPFPQTLAKATEDDLAPCRLGYRAKYLIETARRISENPEFLEELDCNHMGSEEAVEKLRTLPGVGPKVANCVALFCLGQVNSFPIDVWMRRVMNRMYGIPESDFKTMKEYADSHFAPYGGIAQQYMFYHITHTGMD